MAVRIEIGSGEYPRLINEGYLHADVRYPLPHQEICLDLAALPFQPDSIDSIAVIHCLEHISWRKTIPVLNQVYRVIKPLGFVHIHCPNLLYSANRIIEIENDVADMEEIMPSETGTPVVLQDIYCAQNFDANFHKAGFTPKSLEVVLNRVGFTKIEHLTKLDECGLGMKGYKDA